LRGDLLRKKEIELHLFELYYICPFQLPFVIIGRQYMSAALR